MTGSTEMPQAIGSVDIEKLVLSEYPGAKTGEEVTETYLELIAKEYNSDLKKMLFATSVCSDDVNVSTDFRRVLSRPFTMGGLGGLPYSGFTGMVAFSHHIPDGGDGFIFYGPHIGITDEGELGRLRRIGQKRLTNSCGALMLALERFGMEEHGMETYVPHNVDYDYQQMMLETMLMPFKHQILTADDPKKEITSYAYYKIDKQIKRLVKLAIKEFRCEKIFLLGGIIVNTSEDYHEYVQIKNFDVIYLKETLSLLPMHNIMSTAAFKNL
jgi:hypothetical protein